VREVRAGTENERDCIVSIKECDGLKVEVDVKVDICKDDVFSLVEERVKAYGVDNAHVYVKENGALDYVIKARLDYVLYRFTGKKVKEDAFERRATDRKRPRRSRLYVPGNNPRLLINAGVFESDCVILDLEDSVPLDQKDSARFLVKEALRSLDFGDSEIWVRVNREFLEEVEFKPPQLSMFFNVTAKPETDPKKIRELMWQQLCAPVLWCEEVKNMYAAGVNVFVETGPKQVLKGLIEKTLPAENCKLFAVERESEIRKLRDT
jgi:citrate lyase acyl carrier protein